MDDGLGRERLARPGFGAQARGEVQGCAAIAGAHWNRLTGIQPDADAARQLGLLEPRLELHRRAQRPSRRDEDHESFVAA